MKNYMKLFIATIFMLVVTSSTVFGASPIELNTSWVVNENDVKLVVNIFSTEYTLGTDIWISSDSGVDIERSYAKVDINAGENRVLYFQINPKIDGNHTISISAKSAEINRSWFGDQEFVVIQKDGNNIDVFDEQKIYIPTNYFGEKITPLTTTMKQFSSQVTSSGVSVMGYFYYRDYFGNQKPFRRAKVYIYNSNAIIDQLLGTTFTDDNGFYSTGPFDNSDAWPESGTLDIYAIAETSGPITEVKKDIGSDNFYRLNTQISYDVPDGVVDLGGYIATGGMNNASSAFDAAISAWKFFSNNGYTLPKVNVRWPSRTFLPIIDLYGAYYQHGGDIYLGMDAAISPDVLAHEYGHFAMYRVFGNWMPQTNCPENHQINKRENPNCAWTEGWAELMPMVIFSKRNSVYHGHWDYDTELCPFPGDLGDDVESSVLCSLYDIYDNENDGYDKISTGFGSIWNTVKSTRLQNFSQFWNVWKAQGNDIYGGLGALYQNGIDYCQDSDHDGYKEKPCGTDCNDANANINPGKVEVCNNIDDNCNGLVDEGFDKDGDGYTTCNGDCNDNNAAVSPGAQEVCGDGVDNNCNGQQNEGCACSNGAARQCGTDAGECEFGVQTCSSGQWGACVGGVVPKPETCNGKDDDCDGQTDEIFCGGSNYCYDMISTPTSPIYAFINNVALGHKCANYWYYIDIDNDGRSEFYKLLSEGPLRTWFFCHAQDFLQPKKVADIIRSGGTSIGCTSNGDVISEISKSYCDSAYEYSYVDQSFSTPQASLYSTDMFCVVEGNNWGWNSQLLQSDQGENYLILNCGMDADCPSDQYCKKPTISNPATYYCASRCGNGVCESNENCPADSQGVETCDGVDNNCNGVIDDGLAISCSLNSNCPSSGCYQGTYRSYSCSNAGKCSSKCEFSTLTTDSDGDGYDTQCDNDCNDSDVATRPGAIEVCDGRDNNCDGAIPEDEKDADHDGVRVCQGDCNDINAAASPLLNESCSDNIDNNCNGLVNETCCTDECSPGDGMCTGDSVRNSVMVCGNHDSDLCAEWPVNQSADCGNSTYGVWSAWYCSGRNMTRNRTAVLKGCLLGACFQNNVFEFSDSNCPNGCINGFCIQLAGDINGDCIINIFDLAAVGLSFGSRYDEIIWNANADSATDGQIDIFDLAYVGVRFGDKC